MAPPFLIEPHNTGDIVEAKVGEVGLGTVQRISVLNLGVGMGSAEGEKAPRDEPVEVPILHLLVVLVLLAVKVLKVEEAGRLGLVDGVQAVQNGDGVHRDPEGGVPEKEVKI